ncbi:MAG: hypothetical protein H0W73_10760 [Bacteroidetes bacterium]|nr:hypothetical protein [Bacteroidota bacterium]
MHSFKLIDGQFTSSEARSVLFALVNSKINFHSMESFGIRERTSGDTSFHEKRIKELAQTNIDMKNILDYAEENKLQLRIDGPIEIKLVNESKGN